MLDVTRTWYLNGKPKGLVAIDVSDLDGRQSYSGCTWTQFWYPHDLGWHNTFEDVVARTHCPLTPLADLGEYPLYIRFDHEEGRIEVASTEVEESVPILAREVPLGASCFDDADFFFQLWKGRDAVDEHGILIL